MRLLHRLRSGLRALFQKRREDDELDEELRAFLDAEVEARLRDGVTREQAIRAARAHHGSLEAVKDRTRDAGWESHIDSLWRDMRYAVRGWRRSPGFAAVAVLTLALGIGANSAIFSVVNGLLLRSLPVAAPEQLAMVSSRQAVTDGYGAGWNYAVWDQIRQRASAFDGALAWTYFPQRFELSDVGESDPADGLFVSGDFFGELGVPALFGRTFGAADDAAAAAGTHVAVMSHGFWQRRFGGAPEAIGRTLMINRTPVTVVGVAPPAFLGPEVGRAFELALPFGSAPAVLNEPTWGTPEGRSYLAVMLRLKPGQSRESAATLLRGMQRQIIEEGMPRNALWGPVQDALLKDPFVLTPASAGTSELRRQYSQPLMVVLVIAATVLLIACANIANLLLARATARQEEWQVRAAIGASHWRLFQQALVESLLLSVTGAALGLVVAIWGSRALVAQLSTWFDRIVIDLSLDWRVVGFTAAAAIITGALFGAAPGCIASGVARRVTTPTGARTTDTRRTLTLRGGLGATQVALSLILLVAAGLFLRTLQKLEAVPLGFDSDRVLVVSVNASHSSVAPANRTALYGRLAEASARVPGVAYAAASLNTPVNRGVTLVSDFTSQGGLAVEANERRAIVNFVTPGWFETYGIAINAGRPPDARDSAAAPPVAVVNESFARRYFGASRAVGRYISATIGPPEARPPTLVIGVAADAIDQSIRFGAFPTVYQPLSQLSAPLGMLGASEFSVSVRAASGPPAALIRPVAAALTGVDRSLTFSFYLLEDQVRGARNQERLVAWLAGFFGGLALLLAAIGLYGVTSFLAARRRAEIAIRIALGARRRDVVGLSIQQTAATAAIGLVAGLAVAAAVTRSLQSLLFAVTPLDPATFIGAPILLAAIALLACYLPARRAARIDPMIALRAE